MSTEEERLYVLQMVAEGKITAEEGAELLRALEAAAGDPIEPRERSESREPEPGGVGAKDVEDAGGEPEEGRGSAVGDGERERGRRRGPRGRRDWDDFDIPGFDPDMIGRTVREAVREATQATGGIGEMLRRMFGAGPRFEVREELEGPVEPGLLDVQLRSANGRIELSAWDEPRCRLSLLATVPAASEEEARKIVAERVARLLAPDRVLVEMRNHGAMAGFPFGGFGLRIGLTVPRSALARVAVATSNGRIAVKGLGGPSLRAHTSNGRVELRDVGFEDLDAATSNGRIVAVGAFQRADLRTSNGSIAIHLSSEVASKVRASTSNGTIRVRVPDDPEVGVRGNASTSFGGVTVRVGQLRLRGRSLDFATPGYEQRRVGIEINARTSNGAIHIGHDEPIDG